MQHKIKQIIDMFFAQGQLYKRATGTYSPPKVASNSWVECVKCVYRDDCETCEMRDGCYLGEGE